MVFKRLRQAMGEGGPTVETVLADSDCRPGGQLAGRMRVTGGDHPVDVSYLALSLVTRVEVESADGAYDTDQEFGRQQVTGSFRLAPGQRHDVPFRFPVPWQTPLTDLCGQRLPGMTMGLRTELEVARAVDQGDLDPVAVRPLPAQESLLDALLRLGFRFAGAAVERGHLYGVRQDLPFYQEIEFDPAPRYADTVHQLELTFVTDPQRVEVILELDKRGGPRTEGRDNFGRFTVDHATAHTHDWTPHLTSWLHNSLP
ncbi:sporulation protein [Micromonospora sp. PLK6-60]|uniref:sporulation protein n=1 Tax=Micromonospora sp. PLK6-60 TaxID=2873383 RepID=UPI001CA770E7|nr:sporulation protein [Micromonospora sp. PLK6-60]MBY8871157.1 sporulation protein [Micromonospora sp. PLK6-60]